MGIEVKIAFVTVDCSEQLFLAVDSDRMVHPLMMINGKWRYRELGWFDLRQYI
jgi:hypothetical protein